MRYLSVVLICAASSLGFAQGGFGGLGGGGQGGNFVGDSEVVRKQLFLSPGDRTEWQLDAKEHEALLVKVTSSVFDPAVAIQDESGKKLAENDDVEPGDQSAQLIYALPKAGKYKVVVTNYKGTAGGQFDFEAQRFFAVDTRLDDLTTIALGDKRAWARVELPKAADYALTVRTSSDNTTAQVLRSNGRVVGILNQVDSSYGRTRFRFRAEEAGTYFVRFGDANAPTIRIAPIVQRKAEMGSANASALAEDAIEEWTVDAKAGDVFEATTPGEPDDIVLDATPADDEGRPIFAVLKEPSWVTVYGIGMLRDGPVTFAVYNRKTTNLPYTLRLAKVAKPFQGSSINGSLTWNESQYWTFQGKVGDVVKLTASAPGYSVEMSVLQPDGPGPAAAPAPHTSGIERGLALDLNSTGQYVVQVSGGGIGAYKIEKTVIAPKPIHVGTNSGTLVPGTPDVWRFAGKKGQDFVFRIASPGLHWSVRVFGPRGNDTGRIVTHTGTDADLLRVHLDSDGETTVIIRSSDSTAGPYTFKWIDLDQ